MNDGEDGISDLGMGEGTGRKSDNLETSLLPGVNQTEEEEQDENNRGISFDVQSYSYSIQENEEDFFEDFDDKDRLDQFIDQIRIEESYRFFTWNLLAFLGCILSLIFSSVIVFNPDSVPNSMGMKWFIGLSAFLLWSCLAQYLSYVKGFYVLVLTVIRAFPKVMQFLLGILPFFTGYALFGMILFGDEADLFGSIPNTCVTLFAVVNGDEILSTFEGLAFMGMWGQLYLIFFTLLFTYVVLMSIIAIVEEAFFSSTTMVSEEKRNQRLKEARQSNLPSSYPIWDSEEPSQISTDQRNAFVSYVSEKLSNEELSPEERKEILETSFKKFF